MTTHEQLESRVIARQLALGFGLVSVVAVGMCALLLLLLGRVGGLVDHMRHDEHAIRSGAELSTAIRERYAELARAIIDDTDDPGEGAIAVRRHLDALAPRVPQSERWRLEQIRAESREIGNVFAEHVRPAMRAGDIGELRRAHAEMATIATQASAHADAVAEAVEGRMAGAHVTATDVTRVGTISGISCVVLVLALAVGYTVRLRRSVLAPLRRLTDAARAVGAGERHARLGRIGQGELQEVATAFDQMTDELVAREERLLKAERMAAIGQLAAGVAHEMNNPIGIIRGYLKTMKADEDPDVLAEELRIIDDEAAACQRIAEDLLAYARPPDMQREKLAMGAFLEEAARRLSETGELAGRQIAVDAEPADVVADGRRLRQVMANLALNAAQAQSDGPVEISGHRTAEGYVIEVADRGPGIPAGSQARVFEPFYSERPGGSGLGLAVCQGIIAAHAGTIEAVARPGGGTTMRVFLPISLTEPDR